ncbi:integrin alpha-PS3-like [Ostrinia furnacalis]|uniref:integrin alpha-PS3-like n=1 Tax=Ostrinia furnacalis TaxID=93504 RepID=UPI00103F232F|nr:integrin alpha-PS3-like [Ostrinia furnacalis]
MLVLLLLCGFNVIVSASDVFHVNSKITFYPDDVSEYFGYSVLLSDLGLNVGAPKAQSRVSRKSYPGLVFTCPLRDLDRDNVTCRPLAKSRRISLADDFYKDDMWYGATMAAIPNGRLLVCSPRITKPYQSKHLLANGACSVHGHDHEVRLLPLEDPASQARRTDGTRKEYGEYGSHLNYYAYGQAGMAVTYTKENKIVIGAPGVLQWTGTLVDYQHNPASFTFDLLPSTNPYYTKDLGPDDYFGYSVGSGVFQKNGSTLYVAGAPRSKRGYGQVLVVEQAVREDEPLKIKAQLIGPQLGSYFGASLCTLDLDNDGLTDLLVGAPNYALRSDGELTYDQGAVYVYITKQTNKGFVLEESGVLRGSGNIGARFGTSIADLGDINGDGFTDVAIGAPWENNGAGVVYIYRGSDKGLIPQYIQRIHAEGAKSFGMSISKGYDVDKNKCNDLAIGAHKSSTTYLYRSVPTIQVLSSIKVPDAKNIRKDASNFTALFCVTVPPNKSLPNAKIELNARVTVDPERNRARTMGEPEYIVTAESGVDTCDEHIIKVNDEADLSKPISLSFDLTPVIHLDSLPIFPVGSARLSEESILQSSFLIQMLSDCGEDLICTPWLVMKMEPLKKNYIPGDGNEPGVKIFVTNLEEPAYSVKLHVVLPSLPKRLPESCSLQKLELKCDLPAPLNRNKTAEWEIVLEYTWDGSATQLMLAADLVDPLYMRNVSTGSKELIIPITPESYYNFSGKSQPQANVSVTRETFDKKGDVLFTHFYEIANYGPSDLYNLKVDFLLSDGVCPASSIEGSSFHENKLSFVAVKLEANSTTGYILPLRFNHSQSGDKLNDEETLNVTSKMFIYVQNGKTKENWTMEVTTTLLLEPKTPIWPLIVGLVAGLLVLAAIIAALYKFGFFSRQKKEDLKQLIENQASQEDPGNSSNPSTVDTDSTTRELLDITE